MNIVSGITVIIPTYNSEKFLSEAIDSVLVQKYCGPVEIIISDDGSNDKTIDIASGFGERVKILRKPEGSKSQGAAGARNRGIMAATQPYICFLDSDDFYLKNHFEAFLKVISNQPDIGFVFSRMLEGKQVNGKLCFRPWTYPKITKQDIENPVVSRSHIVHTNSFIFRKEVFNRAGLFNENYSNGEDGDLWMRISELYKGEFSDHYGAVYRTDHGAHQLTKNQKEMINSNSLTIFNDALRRYYQLKLKDTFRLFKLKQNLLTIKYGHTKTIYRLQYSKLIFRYPDSVWYIFREYFHNHQKRKENVYKELSCFI
jgi:glycosyltransferase involved in cell wall biosynthesis